MIYKNKQLSKDQRGVTLLLSVLVLSGITLVAAAVTAFTIQEVRSARGTVLSEPAFHAAETGAEIGIYNAKRSTLSTITDCSASPAFQNIPNTTSGATVCKAFGTGTYNITSGGTKVFYLYDPSNFNTNVDLISYPYPYLDITNSSTFAVNVTITRLDGTPVTSTSIPSGATPTRINIAPVASGAEGRMMVTLGAPFAAATVTVSTPPGLPDFLNISASGCSAKSAITNCDVTGRELYNRKIEVQLNSN